MVNRAFELTKNKEYDKKKYGGKKEMSKKLSVEQENSQKGKSLNSSEIKKHFKEPKLTFIEPKLTKQGDATKITGQPPFFQTFIP